MRWILSRTPLHDPAAKLRRAAGPGATPDQAFGAWWEATEPRWAQKTFDDVEPRAGETPEDVRRRFGRSVFDALVTGVHMTPQGAFGIPEETFIPKAFEGTSNVARKLSKSRTLFWKDADAWNDNQKQFGVPRTLSEGIMLTLDKSARQLALLDKLGTNPAGNFNLITRAIQERYRGDLDGVKKFQGRLAGLDAVMQHLDGRANIPANEMAARIGQNLRIWENLSSLGSVGLTHFASIWPTVTSEMAHHGESRLLTLGKLAQAMVRGRGSLERQEVLAQLGAYSDGMVRDMFSRFNAEDTIPGRMSALANVFMKYTGIRYIFDNTQAAVREMLANHLARNAGKEFDALDPHLSQILGKYGLGADEWNLLRAVPDLPMSEGRAYLTPRDGLRVDPAGAEALLRSRGQLASDADAGTIAHAVGQLQQGLSDKLYSYYGDAAAHSTVTPGVQERAFALGADRPGSLAGELRRFIAQFKMWPLAAMNQIIGREIHMSLSRGEAAWNIGLLVALSTAGGYLRLSVGDAAEGRLPRRPLDPAVLSQSLAEGGGLGVLGDFLFGEASRLNGGLVGATAGPAVGDADQLVKITFGEWKQGKAGWLDLAHLLSRRVPFANLIYLKGALDYLLWYHLYEAASPGWWERTNRRLLRQTGHAMSGYSPGAGVPWTPFGNSGATSGGSQADATPEPSQRLAAGNPQNAEAVRMPQLA